MPARSLFRLAALAGFVSAVAIVVGKLLMLLPADQPGEIADFVSPLLGLGAMVGVYLWQRAEAGRFGAAAFAVVFIGLALVTSLDFFGAFIRLELSEQLRDELLEGSPGVALAISGVIFLVGVIMFGISLIRSGVYPPPAGWLFILGFVFVPLVDVVGEAVVVIASIVAGVSIFWLSAVLWTKAGTPPVAESDEGAPRCVSAPEASGKAHPPQTVMTILPRARPSTR